MIARTYIEMVGEVEESFWIDAETFLPARRVAGSPGEDVPASSFETVYSDFGAPVDVEVPAEAFQPTPTPVSPAPADPLTSDSPTEIAEGLLLAIIDQDLEAARRYFAPDQQPGGWEDVYGESDDYYRPPGGENRFVVPEVSGRKGIPYVVTERRATYGVEYADISIVFETACSQRPQCTGNCPDAEWISTITR